MDSLWYRRYRNGGGDSGFPDWETSASLNSWDDAPAPAKVGKILLEAVSGRELGPQHVRLVNNITHWGYGLLAGAPYGVVVGSRRSPKLWYGLPFGFGVWAPAMSSCRPSVSTDQSGSTTLRRSART